jgi:hypothetical protein
MLLKDLGADETSDKNEVLVLIAWRTVGEQPKDEAVKRDRLLPLQT